jgi:xylulokinase
MTDLVLGIDLSTHGVKVLAVDAAGDIHAQAEASYTRTVMAAGIQEQQLGAMSGAIYQSLRQITGSLAHNERIVGLAITTQRGTVIGLDELDEPVGSAVCDSDTRSWPQAHFLAERIGAEVLYARTGCPPLPFNGLTKILWWQHEKPESARRVAHWVSIQDWAVHLLTGELLSSPGSALRLGILDIHNPVSYVSDLLEELEIPLKQFPPLRPFGQPLGLINPVAARMSGIPEGLPIFPAPGDQPAAVLGTSALANRAAMINLGTSFLLSFPVQDFVPPSPGNLYTLEVLPEGSYALELGEGAGTNVLDWLRLTLLKLPSVESLNELAMDSQPGAHGLVVIPHWWAALNDQRAGSMHGLTSSHTRADLVRATLEGLAYEMRIVWEKLSTVSGSNPNQASVCGGAARSDLLCDILANVLDRPILRGNIIEASALGAAITAAVGINWFNNYDTAAKAMCHDERRFEPNPEECVFYRGRYPNYLSYRYTRT